MSRNILGQGQAGTFLVGGQLNINTLGATKIQGDRITNNSIDFYTADVEATSQDDWNINLEASVESFEAGINLVKECQQQLEKAELKVKELLENISSQELDNS